MMIVALDLATRTGFAYGASNAVPPQSGTVRLKADGGAQDDAFYNLECWLDRTIPQLSPNLIVVEAPFNLAASNKQKNSQAAAELSYGLHGVLRGFARGRRIRLERAHPATVRKHFIGRGNAGDREASKAAVVKRCQLLGYMPRNSFSDDRADAIATWDFAQAHFARASGGKLVLFEAAA